MIPSSLSSEPTVEKQEYIHVKPARVDINRQVIKQQLKILRSLEVGRGSRFSGLLGSGRQSAQYEFLILSEGPNEPVEFYYSTDHRLNALQRQLRNVYPSEFRFEQVQFNLADRLSPTGKSHVKDEASSISQRFDDIEPVGISWYGAADRRNDWMTSFDRISDETGDGVKHQRMPLSPIVDQVGRFDRPIAIQVLFRRKPDWSFEAERRIGRLRDGRDTVMDRILDDIEGESSDSPDQDEFLDIAGKARAKSIRDKNPDETFSVNISALSLIPSDGSQDISHQLTTLGDAFEHLSGRFYNLQPKRFYRGIIKGRRVKRETSRVLNSEMRDGWWWQKSRPDIVMSLSELAGIITVPPPMQLTDEAGRVTDAEPQSRTSLSLPSQHHLDALTDAGMAIGRGLGEDGVPTKEPIRIPTDLLPLHLGRFATTGAGKSVTLINDALSLHEQTSGPVFLIDSKGGSLPENYMRAHQKRFGVTELESDVLHFSVPDILPGFAFFDITPALEDGVRRVDAIQNKADHYEELIKLVMGPEKYEDAIVSQTLIKYLMKAMYDEEHGLDNGDSRESINYFSHDQFEQAVTQYHAAGPPDATPEDAPQSSNPQVAEKLKRHLRSNPGSFLKIVGGISSRMDYITQDAHLRRIFNNTQSQFDFRELLDEDKVVIFDLGELRDEAARVMTGVILTELYDAIKRREGDELAQQSDHYVANLLIDEASSVVVSDTLTTLLEKGREFGLSIELVTQFPAQIEEAGNREVYLNVLNNIGNSLVGKILVDADIAEALSYEAVDPIEFKNRISSLPRGEWIAQLPSLEFGETGPEPFSIEPLPVPPGHPDSDQPLTEVEEERFQDALDRVHEHTREQYGVVEKPTTGNRNVTTNVRLESGSDLPLEVAMARAIRTVQLSNDIRKTNDWVSVETVDEELLSRINESTIKRQGYEALPDVREASSLIEVNLSDEASTVQCRLTDEGEQAAQPDTSTSPTGGGEAHDSALATAERALPTAGFFVEVLDQNGAARPDAVARHSDLDTEVQIEVETTTHVRPAKVLANLRKAQEHNRVPLFVVTKHKRQSATDIANRLAKILQDPRNSLASGETRLYTTNHNVTFNGGAQAADGVTAIRPAIDGTRDTLWFDRDGSLVLEDGSGNQYARVDSFESVSKDQFPATYSYDVESEMYTIFRPGELPETYESREAFETEWVPVKRPFVPRTDLPVPDYSESSYAIGILTDNNEPALQLYVSESETITELSTLKEAIDAGELHPAGVEPTQETDEESAAQGDDEDDPYGIGAFGRNHITESDDGVVAVAAVYDAYEQFADVEGYDLKPKNRFTQALRDCVEFERDKKWLDGQTRRCYVGLKLRDAGDQGEASDASE